jgi:hypothetical protein
MLEKVALFFLHPPGGKTQELVPGTGQYLHLSHRFWWNISIYKTHL